MKRVIVTGATSMIGAALIKEAVRNEAEVYAIVRPGTSRMGRLPDSPLVHVVGCGIGDLSEINSLPEADVLYHFAWAGTVRQERDDPFIQETNIKFSLDAVRLAEKCRCAKFIGAGSQAEYGIVSGVITERTNPCPRTAYGMAKLSANMLCAHACAQKGMSFAWGRIFSVYGTNDNKGTMLDYAVDRFIAGETAEFSDASQMWNYLYESDAGRIFWLLGKEADAEGIFNVADPVSRPLREYITEFADLCRDEFGLDVSYRFGEKSLNAVVTLNPDTGRLVNAIGSLPETPFRAGAEQVIRAKLRNNR